MSLYVLSRAFVALFIYGGHTQGGNTLWKKKADIRDLKDRAVMDSNGQEIGRVREVEQEMRTGRYSTLHVEVDARHSGTTELGGWHHLPLNTSDMDRDSARLSRTIESLNSQFTNKVILRQGQHSQREFIDKSVTDRNRIPIGTVKDIMTTSENGEFTTLLVELNQDIKKMMSLGEIELVRIKIDRVEDLGKDIRLDRKVEELSWEWSEIILHR